MLIIIDDFLSIDKNNNLVNYFNLHDASKAQWFEGNLSHYLNTDSFISDCIKTVNKYYDLSNMIGCEMWCHNNTRPDWHYDKDEKLFQETNQIKTPMCSIVYYGLIENLKGGEFTTETVTIIPKTNRLIIFSPNIYHSVKEYTGNRMSIAVNTWNYKPNTYL
jgi:hypothetical protein